MIVTSAMVPVAMRGQVVVDRIQHRGAQLMLFKQVTEAAYGRFIRRRSPGPGSPRMDSIYGVEDPHP